MEKDRARQSLRQAVLELKPALGDRWTWTSIIVMRFDMKLGENGHIRAIRLQVGRG